MDTQIVSGTVALVQERRFRLVDDAGRSHLFLLAPDASAEPEQLLQLVANGWRVHVRHSAAPGLTAARVAGAIFHAEPERAWRER
jgi:hypothetical protein